ncbi:hypothetical protein THIOM_004823 [Candidatus Thiomargarita nelsonii]|uniref:Uncharacterized protein n=1 Tax=Candidatus Thiomargarita nelsonii TaxID=1003181 RepID=A0A176RUZ0_9GAMM|nr:hypothetical protein THIOM_004823 [Candidatus Thiomargarita nelsonii]
MNVNNILKIVIVQNPCQNPFNYKSILNPRAISQRRLYFKRSRFRIFEFET